MELMSPTRKLSASLGGICHSIAHNAEDLRQNISHEAEEMHKLRDKMMHELNADPDRSVSSRLSRKGTDMRGHEELENIKRSLQGLEGLKDEEEPRGHGVVDTMWFSAIFNFLTLLNTLQMGLEADHPSWHRVWTYCENVFTAGFTIELVIKLCALGCSYFNDKANWLDGFLTLIGIVDCWILVLIGSGAGWDLQDLSALRILRLLRLARMMRLVRSVKPMVLVIRGVVKAMTHATYVFALCIFIFYVIAIFVTEHLGRSSADIYPGFSTEMEAIDDMGFMASYNPHVCFGSMLSSMLTLFNMAVMSEWPEIVRPIAVKQPWYLPIFLFFATSVGFGVMNVLIGVIVDCVTSESRRIESEYDEEVKKQKLEILEKIQAVLNDIDRDHDGVIDLEDLAQAWGDNLLLKELTDSVNLPSGFSAQELMDMCDLNGDGVLQHAEFTLSFFRLIDSDEVQQRCMMQASINHIKHEMLETEEHMATRLDTMHADIASIKAALGVDAPTRDAVHTASELKSHPTESCLASKPTEPWSNGLDKDLRSADITKELDGVSTVCCSHGPRCEGEIISPMQLREVLDAAFMSVKEYIHEEFVAIKPCLEPKLIRLQSESECECAGVQNCRSLGCLDDDCNDEVSTERYELSSIGHFEDSEYLGNGSTVASCGESPFKTHTSSQTAPSNCYDKDCAHAGDGNAAVSCLEAALDVHAGEQTSSNSHCKDCEPPGDGNSAAYYCAEASLDFHTGQTISSNGPCEDCEPPPNGNYVLSWCAEAPLDVDADKTMSSHGHCEDCEHAGDGNAVMFHCAEAPFVIHTGETMSSHGCCEDCHHADNGNAVVSRCSEEPLYVHMGQTVSSQDQSEYSQHPGNINPVMSCCAATHLEVYRGIYADSLHVSLSESHASDAVLQHAAFDTKQDICDFFFEDGTERLGFTVHWVKDRLPMVGEIEFGSAAYLQGVLQGDRLSRCNGVFIDGKQRQEILQILKERPLMLKILRQV